MTGPDIALDGKTLNVAFRSVVGVVLLGGIEARVNQMELMDGEDRRRLMIERTAH